MSSIRILRTLVLVSCFTTVLPAQVRFEAITRQPALEVAHEEQLRLLRQHSAQRSGADIVELDVISGGTVEWCATAEVIGGKLAQTLEIADCDPLLHGEITADGLCVTYTADAVSGLRRELVCLQLCNIDEVCVEKQLLIRVREPLPIPFFEDFSSAESPYPDPVKWLDRHVYINQTLGKDPVSLGVATFDGLNAGGSPYGGTKSRADSLTSSFINLGGKVQADNIYLSFYIQPKGMGLRPRAEDLLFLEFRNAAGEWKEITAYPGITGSIDPEDSPAFELKAVRLIQEYLHDAFQFRFVNINSRTGVRELWHLDYIRITEHEVPDGTVTDLAFTRPPASFLTPYTAMPARQFRNREDKYLNQELQIGLYNHFANMATAEPSRLLLRELLNDHDISSNLTLLEVPPVVPVNQRNLSPGRHDFVNPLRTDTWFSDFIGFSRGLDSMRIRTTYTFNQPVEENANQPLLLLNNRTSKETVIKDYYAYDDGSAELAISVHSNPGNFAQMAVKYHAETGDSLKAIQFHFPHVNGDVSSQLFNIKVWIGELKEEADYEAIFQKPVYPDRYTDSLQGFTSYGIMDEETFELKPLYIPPGDFYIGWQQVTVAAFDIPVGYDRNNPHGVDFVYFNAGSGWKPLNQEANRINGAVMIRPSFGDVPPPLTGSHSAELESGIRIYPNPTKGWLRAEWPDTRGNDALRIRVFNTLGQQMLEGPLRQEIDLGQLPAGLYLINVYDDRQQHISRHKILLNP